MCLEAQITIFKSACASEPVRNDASQLNHASFCFLGFAPDTKRIYGDRHAGEVKRLCGKSGVLHGSYAYLASTA